MMRRKRYTVAAVLLLCGLNALCSEGVENPKCGSNWKEECFLPDYHLNSSNLVSLTVSAGKKLLISLKGAPIDIDCKWRSQKGQLIDIEETVSTVIQQLSKTDSGMHTLSCTTVEEANFSKSLHLFVSEPPSKPQLSLYDMDKNGYSPRFKCVSEGSPRPTIQWSPKPRSMEKNVGAWTEESSCTSSTFYDSEAKCCAVSNEGKECNQLYDFDLSTSSMQPDHVTISPGEALLLRCRNYGDSEATWEHNDKVLVKTCEKNKICIINDQHFGKTMLFAFIRSATSNHSGSYTCKGPEGRSKTMFVDVTDEPFLSSQLSDQFVITDNSSCLTAEVSYRPELQLCYWEAPDGSLTKCIRDTAETKNRTVRFCGLFLSGLYKLHLKAGVKVETKSTSVCVVEEPRPIFEQDKLDFIVETVSLLPANSTWKSHFSPHSSNETFPSWKEIQTSHHPASVGFCNQKLRSNVAQNLVPVKATELMFCLTSKGGSWCKEYNLVQSPRVQFSKADPPSDSNIMLLKIGVVGLLLAFIVAVMVAFYIKKKKPQYQPQLQMIQMVGPNDNDYIYINFKDFEYDKKWEFPRENLELGKELGSGAFGMVLQATAYGINRPGVSQQVAVKMLKDKHQSVEKEALMSELKMLTHIGQHDNVVNLLGACTKTGPIYLIFQYCCYGDLLNYLKKSSDRYHKSVTDAFSKDRFSSLYSNLHFKKNSNELFTAEAHYLPMNDSTTRGQEDITLIPLSSNDMEDPEMNESEDDQMEKQALTFNDLLSFAFQVAKGMEFLSAKNCIHRDLAARNVLVTKGRLVKIGDFGLARDIDNDSNYVVRGNVRLPVKWMAPESIFEGMYTMKSDVWAYGILLWEIFSLGITPYPGIKVDHTFYSMIERGFKMECPYYANDSVYQIMCKCWALDPNNRPSFSKLVDFMTQQLMDMEEMLYQNILDRDFGDYQNSSTIVDISALVKESGSKMATANNYCKANLREEAEAEALKSPHAEEEELLKPSDGE